MSERDKLLTAILASALVHLLAAAFLVVVGPVNRLGAVVAQQKPARALEVTLMRRPPPPSAVPTPTPSRSVIASDGLTTASKPPEQARFESDKDTSAASELPATGNLPLPTQEGKEERSPEFETKDYVLGPIKEVGGRPSSSQAQPVPKPELAKILQQPKPELAKAQSGLEVPKTALATSSSPSAANKPADAGKDLPSTKSPSSQVGYQRQTEKTRIEGNISNRGRSSLDALGTPLGRYRKAVADAIGSRWYYYVNQRMDLITVGDAHIKFQVDRDGRVQNLNVLSNSSNETFANYCMQSITEAKVPPIPAELAGKLEDGRLEIQYTFTIYPQ